MGERLIEGAILSGGDRIPATFEVVACFAPEHPLAEKQFATLRTIEDYIAEHGRPPTVRELRSLLPETQGHSFSAVKLHLNALINKGYVERILHEAFEFLSLPMRLDSLVTLV